MHTTVVITWMSRYHVCMPINWIWASLCVWWVHLLFVFLSFLHEGQILGQAIQKRTLILMSCHDSCSSSSWGRWGGCPHTRRQRQSTKPPAYRRSFSLFLLLLLLLLLPLLLLLCCPDPRSTRPSKPSTSDGALDDRRSSAPTEPWNCCSLARPSTPFPTRFGSRYILISVF
jgi:hypothetical protein